MAKTQAASSSSAAGAPATGLEAAFVEGGEGRQTGYAQRDERSRVEMIMI